MKAFSLLLQPRDAEKAVVLFRVLEEVGAEDMPGQGCRGMPAQTLRKRVSEGPYVLKGTVPDDVNVDQLADGIGLTNGPDRAAPTDETIEDRVNAKIQDLSRAVSRLSPKKMR